MRLPEGHSVISMVIPEDDGLLLTVCQNGYGKRTRIEEFPTKGRGGKGMIAIQASERNGPLVGLLSCLMVMKSCLFLIREQWLEPVVMKCLS
jgi:DNA gyrase subunit A